MNRFELKPEYVALAVIAIGLCSTATPAPAAPQAYPIATMPVTGGVPFIKRAGWLGVNTWFSYTDVDLTRGYFLTLPVSDIGTKRDLYASSGVNIGFLSPLMSGDWDSGPHYQKEKDFVTDSLNRLRKAGLKASVNLDQAAPGWMVKSNGWSWIDDHGKKIMFPAIPCMMYHDPAENARVYGQFVKPIIDLCRDDPNVIDYQISGENFPFNTLVAKADVSYDPLTIGRFRDYMRGKFTLAQAGLRYGNDPNYYRTWDDVFPPMGPDSIFDNGKTKAGKDFGGKPIDNYLTARWDWYRCKKQIIGDIWVGMLKTIQDIDGHDRPINYEFNHGPYMNTRIYPLTDVGARVKNFHVGNGDFCDRICDALNNIAYQKTTTPGPWVNNEIDGGSAATSVGHSVDAAYVRRHIWGTLALGAGGYNFWTFPNILGAPTEFVTKVYDPGSAGSLPLKYWETKHTNQMIDSLGKLLSASRAPALDIGLMFLDESTYNWTYVASYQYDSNDIVRTVSDQGLGDRLGIYTEYTLDRQPQVLRSLKTIILPQTPRITETHMQVLADWVKNGGTLILMGDTGRYGEMCKEFDSYPGGPLAAVTGVAAHAMSDNEVCKAPTQAFGNGKSVNLDVNASIEIPAGSHAQVIAHSGNSLLITSNHFGKGMCYYLAGAPRVIDSQDSTQDMLVKFITGASAGPAVRLQEGARKAIGVFASRRVSADGVMLFLIDDANKSHNLKVTIDPAQFGLISSKGYHVFECFSQESHEISAGAGWQFATALEPVGVRCYLVTSLTSLNSVIPAAQRMNIPRSMDAQLLGAGSGRAYYARDIIDEHLGHRKERVNQLAAGYKPAPLLDLGRGYKAVDLSGYANTPLDKLILDVDYTPQGFGAQETGAVDTQTHLPIGKGVTSVGDVPAFSTGSYVSVIGKAMGIPVGAVAKSMSFFAGGQYDENTSVVGFIGINYSDGASVRIPLTHWSTLGDFGRNSWFQHKYVTIWSGKTHKGDTRQLSRLDWENPYPSKPIASLDIVNTNEWDVHPINVWAVTLAN